MVLDDPEVRMLKMQLFGKGEALYNGQSMPGFPSKQCHRLLCYLLLNRQHPQPRERLAAVFWAEYSTAMSRTYLRTCLWRLRQALLDAGAPADDYLLCTGDSLTFPNSGRYWLDVEAFEGALNPCRNLPGDRLDPDQARELQKADSLYVGDLLEGIYDDWCLYDRERLRLMRMGLLCKLLTYSEAAGSYEQGLDYAQRILASEAAREKVHRQAMRLYWLLGSPLQALAQYHLCVQVLREELGVQPTAKTRALYEQMRGNRFDPSQWPAPHHDKLREPMVQGKARQTPSDQLLDRLRHLEAVTATTEIELREVRRLLEKALAGEGRQA